MRAPEAPRPASIGEACPKFITLHSVENTEATNRCTAGLRAVAIRARAPPTGPSLSRACGHPGRSDRPARALHGGGSFGVDPSAPQHDPRTSGRVGGRWVGTAIAGFGAGARAPPLALQRHAGRRIRPGGPRLCRSGVRVGRADRPDQPATARRCHRGGPGVGSRSGATPCRRGRGRDRQGEPCSQQCGAPEPGSQHREGTG